MWLQTEDHGAVRWLWMNRPDRRNAIPPQGWKQLQEAFGAFEKSSQRVLVISGRGGEFCAGADLDPGARAGSGGIVEARDRLKVVGETALALHRLTKPTVAAVDGVAVGAGMSLALGCDVVIATRRARFSAIFVRRGLGVDAGLSWLLPRLAGLRFALEAALSGRMISAEEALRHGLAGEVVESGSLEERVMEVAQGFVEGAPVAQMFIKQLLNRSLELSLEEAIAWEGQVQAICLNTEDHREGVEAFLEKRDPRFRGA